MGYSNAFLFLAQLGLMVIVVSILWFWKGDRKILQATVPLDPLPPKKTASKSLKDEFPPSIRDDLPKEAVSQTLPKQKSLNDIEVDDTCIKRDLIPFTADYRQHPKAFTPTGAMVEEILALGDFPDYASLSGVPLPKKYEGFDITKAIARPYRPFRWAYHQTMSLSNMEPDWWLELEQTYIARIAERETLYAEHGKAVLQYLPGSELGCKEVMEHALQFLCARYPMYFSLSHSDADGYVFHNGLLKTTTVTKDLHPLHVLLHNVPEDFAVMLRNPEDGMYYFRAGVLCSSLGWNVETKIGLQLKDIHGPIPDYKEKMEMSMDRYFSKLPPSRPIQRGSWGLETDTPLYLPPTHPHLSLRDTQDPDLPLSRIHLRVDWQTLRRLPLSGAIIFNFKALFTPVTEFRDELGVPALVAKNLREGKDSILRYKGTWHVQHKVLPALEEWSREQVEKGLVERGWKVGTLEEAPWFRGWEGKWRGRQGF